MQKEKPWTGYPSVDKPWLKYYSEEAINAPLPEFTIYEYIYKNNKDYLDDTAIIYLGKKISYGKLFEMIDRCAASLTALGVKEGEIVTVALPSVPEALYLVYALNKIGAVSNMIHPLAGKQELLNYLNEVQSKFAFLFDGTYQILKDTIHETKVEKAVVLSAGESLPLGLKQLYFLKNKRLRFEDPVYTSWTAFLKTGKDAKVRQAKKDAHSLALISHTGGTTGEPKGVMCSDYSINAIMWQIVRNFKHNRTGTSLSVLPPFVNYSLIESMMAMLIIGYKVVLIPDYKPLRFAEYAKRYRPTTVLSIPSYWEALLKIDANEFGDLSCFQQLYYGGEAMSSETEKAINQILRKHGAVTDLCKGLGSTELTGAATQSYLNCNLPGCAGVPLVKLNCSIVDRETSEELTYGNVGEICFSGPTVMMGYYQAQEATDEIIKNHRDGKKWLHTGDLGYMNEDGVLFVTGRIKRIIMTRGQDRQVTKLFPDRIEKVLNTHPAVCVCCVVGVPDQRRINLAKAVVELNHGFEPSDALARELREFCESKLPEYQIPELISFTDALPRTDRGKVDYRALQKEAETI